MTILKLFVIMAISFLATNCETTPVQKLRGYGCKYFPEKHGFCCEKQVKDEDKYILDCQYGNQL